MKLEPRRGKLLLSIETDMEFQLFHQVFGEENPEGDELITKIQGEARVHDGERYLLLGKQTEEQRNAVRVAKQIVNSPATNPSDDVAMLAQKVLKQDAVIERLTAALVAAQDPTRDLITANRDAILDKHEQAWVRIKNHIGSEPKTDREETVLKILDAVAMYHPMHEWSGWPEGSKS